jgi:hypothetical protein
MYSWIEGLFGSVEAVEAQRIIRTTNLITYEGTLFNELRAARPMETELPEDLHAIVTSGIGDPFCRPLEDTAATACPGELGRLSVHHPHRGSWSPGEQDSRLRRHGALCQQRGLQRSIPGHRSAFYVSSRRCLLLTVHC